MVLPLWAQHKVKSNYEKYSQVRSTSGKTGREVALANFTCKRYL